jgi:transcriptional regulator
LLVRLTDREEADRTPRYTVDAQDEDYLQHMMRQIVAFRIPIVRLEAKAKLNQNRPPEDREGVARKVGGELEALMEQLSL